MKEIILPPHLYDRIKASAGEHGGIGNGRLFDKGWDGAPLCAHGHAWGTTARFHAAAQELDSLGSEPELLRYLTPTQNDTAIESTGEEGTFLDDGALFKRIPFERWCELLNVKRGKDENFITAPTQSDALAESLV